MSSYKLCRTWLLIAFLNLFFPYANAGSYPGQMLQINTHFDAVVGKPTWLLIIRDNESERVIPNLFDMKANDTWVIPLMTQSYKITVSKLTFEPSTTVINDFCHILNKNHTNKSMYITLSGKLSPDLHSIKCDVASY